MENTKANKSIVIIYLIAMIVFVIAWALYMKASIKTEKLRAKIMQKILDEPDKYLKPCPENTPQPKA